MWAKLLKASLARASMATEAGCQETVLGTENMIVGAQTSDSAMEPPNLGRRHPRNIPPVPNKEARAPSPSHLPGMQCITWHTAPALPTGELEKHLGPQKVFVMELKTHGHSEWINISSVVWSLRHLKIKKRQGVHDEVCVRPGGNSHPINA